MDCKTLASFLVWIKDNGYHQYHDGRYYTNRNIRDIKTKTKFYEPEELANLFLSELKH